MEPEKRSFLCPSIIKDRPSYVTPFAAVAPPGNTRNIPTRIKHNPKTRAASIFPSSSLPLWCFFNWLQFKHVCKHVVVCVSALYKLQEIFYDLKTSVSNICRRLIKFWDLRFGSFIYIYIQIDWLAIIGKSLDPLLRCYISLKIALCFSPLSYDFYNWFTKMPLLIWLANLYNLLLKRQ